MPRPKKATTPVKAKTKVEKVFERLEEDEDSLIPVNPKAKARIEAEVEETGERPLIHSKEWSDWVLDQLWDEEKDGEGNPKIEGLRRLAEVLLGDIILSKPTTVGTAESANGYRATCDYAISIRWMNNPDDIRTFGASADVYTGNTDPEYARHAAATADTRAEGRTLRKALRLRKVVTAEEITSLPYTEAGLDRLIVESQIRGINKLCKQLDIDAWAFINSGKNSYDNVTHLRYETAQSILEQLNVYMQNPNKIPSKLVGFKEDWRKNRGSENSD